MFGLIQLDFAPEPIRGFRNAVWLVHIKKRISTEASIYQQEEISSDQRGQLFQRYFIHKIQPDMIIKK